MKILHVWNAAGIASIIAKFMDRIYGTRSWVIMRKNFDPFGFTTLGQCVGGSARRFKFVSLWKASRYDLVHIHSVDSFLPDFRRWFPSKPIVLQYHGDEIRGRWNEKQKYSNLAAATLVSTSELLEDAPPYVRWLPSPVDTELFKPVPSTERTDKSAVTMQYDADDLANKFAERYGLRLTTLSRGVPYLELPRILSQFKYYVDVKRDWRAKVLASLSKTGLEALACGLRVIDWKGDVLEGLPQEHHPENVVEVLYKTYLEIISRR